MPETIKVLFLAAEAEPFVKVGGLGDVAGSLPRAIAALSKESTETVKVDIRLALPFHPVMRSSLRSLKPIAPFELPYEDGELLVEAQETRHEGLPVYFIGGKPIDTSSSIYSIEPEADAEKYTFFSLAALELTRQTGWFPDIVHANDWHAALAAYGLLVQGWQEGQPRPATIITVHNLPYLGPDVHKMLERYNVPLAQTDLPDWARLKPMPLGLWAADAIVAVSPTYADEMLSQEFGSGLEEFLNLRKETISGILNGLDLERYEPAIDENIAAQYTIDALHLRKANKEALCEQVGLQARPEVPLFGVVSRLDPQKGIDMAIKGLRRLEDVAWQAVLLGTGDPKLESLAKKFEKDYPGQVRFIARYDTGLARQIYAGADLFLMPSRYEPCGLSQMIAMRYGCVPIVRAVGGLHDTVTDGETGFVFIKPRVDQFEAAIRRALEVFGDKEAWERLQQTGMSQNFSWKKSALQYVTLYEKLIEERRG